MIWYGWTHIIKNQIITHFQFHFPYYGSLQCRFAWCMGISLFDFVSSLFRRFVVSTFNQSTFFVRILCLIAFVVRLIAMAVEGHINALNRHLLSLSLLLKTLNNSQNSEIEYWIIIIILLFCSECFTHFCCLLSLVYWFFFFSFIALTTRSLIVCSLRAFPFILLIYSFDRITL